MILKEKGLSGIWKQIKGFVGSLKKMLFEGVRNLLITKVVTAAIGKLVTMLNPAGLLAQGIAAIYNIVMFVIERFQQIADVVGAIFKSVAHIAAGKLVEAANYVEKTLALTLPVVISLLARLTIGGVPQHIMKIIDSLKARVKKITIRLVNFIVKKAQRLLGKGKKKGKGKAAAEARHKRILEKLSKRFEKDDGPSKLNDKQWMDYKRKLAHKLEMETNRKLEKGVRLTIRIADIKGVKRLRYQMRIAPNNIEVNKTDQAGPEFKVTGFKADSSRNLKIKYHTVLPGSGKKYGSGITIESDPPYSSKAEVEVEGNTKGVENEVWTIGYTQTLTKHRRVAHYEGKSNYKKFIHRLKHSLPMRDGKGEEGKLP